MKERKHIIKDNRKKKLYVFLTFLLLSTVYWSIIKLSAIYTQTISIEIDYTNLTNDKVLENKPIEKLDVLFKTTGFNLLLQSFSKDKISIDLSTVSKKKNTYFYTTNANLGTLQVQFPLDQKILHVYPDTIFFDFGKLKSKLIKVNPILDINYKTGHSLIGELDIQPKSILINGTEELIANLESIDTKILVKKNIKNDFEYELSLDIPKEYHKIHFATKKITIKGVVEKYTEARLQIPFEIINFPKNKNIKTLDEYITLKYIVSLDNYDKVSASDFRVVCDYNNISSTSSFLIPEIIKKPNLVSNVTCKPEKIEFIIKE